MISWVALKRVARVVAGQSPPSSDVSDLGNGNFPFLQGNAEFTALYPLPRYRCTSAPKVAAAGDILLSVRAPVGALNVADRVYGIGRGLCAIRSVNVKSRYLWWVLHSQVKALQSVATGSTYDAVTADHVADLPLPIADRPSQQQAIADYLDAETARIEALIIKRRRMIELLEEQFASTVSQSLSGLRDAVPLRRIARRIVDGTHGSFERVDSGLPLLSAKNLRAGFVRVTDDESWISPDDHREITKSRRFEPGAILLGVIGGSIGNVARLRVGDPLAFQRSVAAIMVGSDYSTELLWYVANSRRFQESLQLAANSSAQAGVYLGDLASIFVPFGPRKVQVEIVTRLARTERRFRTLGSLIKGQLALLIEHRQALITAAVTGELDIAGAA